MRREGENKVQQSRPLSLWCSWDTEPGSLCPVAQVTAAAGENEHVFCVNTAWFCLGGCEGL